MQKYKLKTSRTNSGGKGGKNIFVPPKKEVVSIENETRINKYLARAGYASRRGAEELILQGRVKINGQTINSLSVKVMPDDIVSVDGRDAVLYQSEIYMYHKPTGLVTTHSDEQGRKTVFDSLPRHLPRLISIGRLDINSEGLLVLTNDSKISEYFENPKNKIERTYKIRLFGRLNEAKLAQVAREGLIYNGIKYQPFDYEMISATDNNCWISITIREGKNREIRNIIEFLGLQISRLIRIGYGDFSLGSLAQGKIIKVANEVTEYIKREIDENNIG